MIWRSLRRRTPFISRRPAELERAYRSVFLCPDGQTVLADLAALSGIYQAPPIDVDPRRGGYVDGRKALFARILSMIRISEEEHAALQEAARLETLPSLPHEDP
ncbi:hypothetical protein [uncultured Roseibium sp.]|uniref:Bbp19 family protein n=1 Tax=uncultured Roseibium sp. TaxID=1936171 RepID=UPI00260FF3FE|nr:hypothetical protein [uncultured Roseibium sp.]